MRFAIQLVVLALILGAFAHPLRADLSVTLSGVRQAEGSVRVALWSASEGFPSETERAHAREVVDASVPAVGVVFRDVAPGRYAVSAIHDRDGNGELNRNFLGIPREAVGISNGAVGFTGPGDFEDALFEVGDGGAELEIDFYHW